LKKTLSLFNKGRQIPLYLKQINTNTRFMSLFNKGRQIPLYLKQINTNTRFKVNQSDKYIYLQFQNIYTYMKVNTKVITGI